MVLLRKENFREELEHIRRKALNPSPTILILSAVDVDSVCATRTLTSLLKTRDVQYMLRPVSTGQHFFDGLVELLGNGEYSVVFLINVGGGIPIVKELAAYAGQEDPGQITEEELEARERLYERMANGEIVFYIADRHRPHNLNNIYHPLVKVFTEDDFPIEGLPTQREFELHDRDGDGEDEDDDLLDNPLENHDFDGEGGSGDGVDSDGRRVRQRLDGTGQYRPGQRFYERREEQRRARMIVDAYYRTPFPSVPVTTHFLTLCLAINQASIAALWNACVSVTEAFLDGSLSPQRYKSFYAEYKTEARTLTPAMSTYRSSGADPNSETRRVRGYWEGEAAAVLRGGDRRARGTDSDAESELSALPSELGSAIERGPTAESSQPQIADGHSLYLTDVHSLKLFMVKHWNIYSSLCHSQQTMKLLRLYSDKGREVLENMLARLGLPLKQAKQHFSAMGNMYQKFLLADPRKSRRRHRYYSRSGHELDGSFAAACDELGIKSLYYRCFNLQIGSNMQIDAADMVHAIATTLNRPGKSTGAERPSDTVDGTESAQLTDGVVTYKGSTTNGFSFTGHSQAEANFHTALDLLDVNPRSFNLIYFRAILDEAIGLRELIVDRFNGIMRNRRINQMGFLWYTLLEENVKPELFSQPGVLTILATFLQDQLSQRQNRSSSDNRTRHSSSKDQDSIGDPNDSQTPLSPFVLCCRNKRTDFITVVYSVNPAAEPRHAKEFAEIFLRVNEDVEDLRVEPLGFDNRSARLRNEDFHNYIETLSDEVSKLFE
eukprot:Clim_evm64s77 gene=Clim_evmTU64s77